MSAKTQLVNTRKKTPVDNSRAKSLRERQHALSAETSLINCNLPHSGCFSIKFIKFEFGSTDKSVQE